MRKGDSNPHGLLRQILSLVRLPIPPLSRAVEYSTSSVVRVRFGQLHCTVSPPPEIGRRKEGTWDLWWSDRTIPELRQDRLNRPRSHFYLDFNP